MSAAEGGTESFGERSEPVLLRLADSAASLGDNPPAPVGTELDGRLLLLRLAD